MDTRNKSDSLKRSAPESLKPLKRFGEEHPRIKNGFKFTMVVAGIAGLIYLVSQMDDPNDKQYKIEQQREAQEKKSVYLLLGETVKCLEKWDPTHKYSIDLVVSLKKAAEEPTYAQNPMVLALRACELKANPSNSQ